MSRVPRSQIARGIANMIDAGIGGKELAKSIATYLVQERRTRDLDGLMRDVQAVRAKRGVVEATATTAFTLSSGVKKDILACLEREFDAGKNPILNEQVDPDVLGGVRIEATGKQLDLTVRSKLNRLKQVTVQGGTN